MKYLFTAIALAMAGAASAGPTTSFDPEVDADRPGRVVFHSTDSLPTVTLARRVDPRFDPEIDSDRIAIAPTIVTNEAVARQDMRFNPETDADRNM